MNQLNGALEALQTARGRASEGQRAGVAADLVRGAEHCYLAALEVEGTPRSRRLEMAAQMARLARELGAHGAGAAASSRRRQPACDRDEGLTQFTPAARPQTRFADVAGLEEAKREIDLTLVRPFRYPEEAERLGVSCGGVLLHGPTGTGKTLLGRAVAGEVGAPFYYIKPSDIMSQWVGVAERNLASLFAEASRHELAVIFIDEVESLVPARGGNRSTVMARVVPQLLAEMDGFEGRPRGLMFIGATNRPDQLDEAMLRPGRLDRKLYIGPPTEPEREALFGLHLQGRDHDPDLDLAALAEASAGFTGADIAGACRQAAKRAFEAATSGGGPDRRVTMDDLRQELAAAAPSVTPAMLRVHELFAARG